MDRARYKKLEQLAVMMRKQGAMRLPINRPLIELFDLVVSDEEADFMLRMGRDYMTREQAASRLGLPREQLDAMFDRLLTKGLLHSHQEPGADETVAVSAFLVGWFERQLMRGEDSPKERAFARGLERLFQSYGKGNIFPLRHLLNFAYKHTSKPTQSIALAVPAPGSKKRVTVNRPVEAGPSEVYPTNSVLELVERHGDSGSIAVVHCFCRYWKRTVGDPCRFKLPDEACLVIGDEARHCVKYGFARAIDKEEALSIVTKVQKRGGIHTVYHQQDRVERPEIAICNCCWDCCGAWGGYNRGQVPMHVKRHYRARVSDPGSCKACNRCQEVCPVAAATVQDGRTSIDGDKCVGCGVCAYHCERDVITMDPDVREVLLPLQPRREARL